MKLINDNIPTGWQEIELSKVVKYEQPYMYAVLTTEYDKIGIPVLTAGKSFILGYTSENDGIYTNLPVIIFDDFTTDCKYVDFEFKVKSSAMKFLKERNKNHTNLKFIFEIISQIKLKSIGGDHKRRWISEYSKRKIVIPKIKPEQTKIAEILSTVDKAIEQTEAIIAKQQRIKTGLMQDLLTKGIDENGNIRSEETHEFKDSPLGRIPVEWEYTYLGIALNKSKGSVQTGPFGSQLHASDYKDEGIPIITVEHLGDNEIIHSNLPLVGKEDYKRLKKYIIVKGDLVFSRVGAIDRCSYVSEKEHGWLFSGRCLRVRCGQINSVYLSYQLNGNKAKNWILNNAVGSTMACLNTTILSNVPIVLPKSNEQKVIVDIFEQLSVTVKNENLKHFKLNKIKTGLMQDLLTGKVRVNKLLEKDVESMA